MAIYYSRLSNVRRSRGHSAVAAAAYRAGTRLRDERTGETHSYSKKRGVIHAEMLAPPHASWARDLSTAWNRAEKAEVRSNACTARELIVALPAELSEERNRTLAVEIGQDLVIRYGTAVLVAVHRPDARGDDRNVHVHFLMSTRTADRDGYGKKTRVLDDRTTGPREAEAMRTRVADRINAALAEVGEDARLDPRRLTVQAKDAAARGDFAGVVELSRTPTRHQGKEATALARRGMPSEVVAENAAVRADNAEVRTWGLGRAAALKKVAQKRARRGARQITGAASPPRASRRQASLSGLGAFPGFTRATGMDAALLNEQAALAHESARVARDAAEAYLKQMARCADQLDADLRDHFTRMQAIARSIPVARSASETHRLVRPELWTEASSTLVRYEAAAVRHRGARKRTAHAQAATATAHAEEARIEKNKPTGLRPLTRREWAEHRRRQRARTAEAEHVERQADAQRKSAAVDLRQARRAWLRAHSALLAALDAAARPQAGSEHELAMHPHAAFKPELRPSRRGLFPR